MLIISPDYFMLNNPEKALKNVTNHCVKLDTSFNHLTQMNSSNCLKLSSKTTLAAHSPKQHSFYIETASGPKSQCNYRGWNFSRTQGLKFLSLLLVNICRT